jgi:prepilin-type N-terminal cleavage/methylation domain-containing protein
MRAHGLVRVRRDQQAGFTLMELTVVIALAGVVTLGLVAFYLNSQMLWMDASTQALAQRDATTIMEAMREQSETAGLAAAQAVGGGNWRVTFYTSPTGSQTGGFVWRAADSLVHSFDASGQDLGPIVPTKVERFALSTPPNLPMLIIDTLRVRSTSGQRVQMSGGFALYNQP